MVLCWEVLSRGLDVGLGAFGELGGGHAGWSGDVRGADEGGDVCVDVVFGGVGVAI